MLFYYYPAFYLEFVPYFGETTKISKPTKMDKQPPKKLNPNKSTKSKNKLTIFKIKRPLKCGKCIVQKNVTRAYAGKLCNWENILIALG